MREAAYRFTATALDADRGQVGMGRLGPERQEYPPMPIAGGAAAKYGDRYEGRWTVRCLIEILSGHAANIRLEPPGHLGEGAEFVLRRPPGREFHQVKRQFSREGVWSLRTLNGQQVLGRLRERLLGAGGSVDDVCCFVSTHAAHPLDELAERARGAQSADEFRAYFARGDFRQDLSELARFWDGLAEDDIWAALRRIYLETISEALLQRWNSERISVLIDGQPDNATDVLAQFVLDSVHQELDADSIWAHLATRGFQPRDWGETASAAMIIALESSDYVAEISRLAIRGAVLPREEASVAAARLDAGAQCLILAGGRGSGKSGVAAQIVKERREAGWHVLPVRADRQEEFSRPAEVGARMGLDTTPTAALAGLSSSAPSLLVIDQLDVVTLSTGRIPQFFDCVEEMREAVALHSNVRLLLVCRSADLEDDPRLRRLLGEGQAVRIDVGPLSEAFVTATIGATACPVERLDHEQLALLRLPLHLRLMTEAAEHPDIATFKTYEDLCRMFNEQKRATYA